VSKPTVCILYGACEGPRVATKLISALQQAGYRVIGDAAVANILIAHSGGCFIIPTDAKARRIMMIGIPYWPGKRWITCAAEKVRLDAHTRHQEGALRFWLYKSVWNFVYAWNLPHIVRMIRGRGRGDHWLLGDRTILVRADDDCYCVPDLAALPFKTPPHIARLPGQHDDCWHYPASYLKLL
jgi:hypothetical protein